MELREAINQIKVTNQKDFHYTDINLILLGFMLEELYGQNLDRILEQEVFELFFAFVVSAGDNGM